MNLKRSRVASTDAAAAAQRPDIRGVVPPSYTRIYVYRFHGECSSSVQR